MGTKLRSETQSTVSPDRIKLASDPVSQTPKVCFWEIQPDLG